MMGRTPMPDKSKGVLSGRFRMAMTGGSVVLDAGDVLVVPKHVFHSAEVVGDEPVANLAAVRIA
jgi:mannose-6-phosphate isomerase-like protein (cupin superfamily)